MSNLHFSYQSAIEETKSISSLFPWSHRNIHCRWKFTESENFVGSLAACPGENLTPILNSIETGFPCILIVILEKVKSPLANFI